LRAITVDILQSTDQGFAAGKIADALQQFASEQPVPIEPMHASLYESQPGEVPNFAREFLEKLGEHIERDLGLAHIREALASMNATARDSMAGDLTSVIEKQMLSIKDAIDMQTKQRLEELRSMLKRA